MRAPDQEAQRGRHGEHAEHDDRRPVPLAAHRPRFDAGVELPVLAHLLPLGADHVRDRAAGRVQQVAWADRSALVSGRQLRLLREADLGGVAVRRGARPGGDLLALRQVERERVLGVHPLDRRPRHVPGAEHVAAPSPRARPRRRWGTRTRRTLSRRRAEGPTRIGAAP